MPTATLSASPASITAGGAATLTWSTTNATSVTINQGIGTVLGLGDEECVSRHDDDLHADRDQQHRFGDRHRHRDGDAADAHGNAERVARLDHRRWRKPR